MAITRMNSCNFQRFFICLNITDTFIYAHEIENYSYIQHTNLTPNRGFYFWFILKITQDRYVEISMEKLEIIKNLNAPFDESFW